MGTLRENGSFVRLFFGRLVTNAGDSMYSIAAMWLVFELSGSTFYTGLAGFLVQIPSSLQFLTGPLVDRWSLRPLLVVTQFVQGVCVLAVPLAAATGHLSVWVVIAVMPLLTMLNQFVYPAQNAALPRLLEDDQLVRANSLFSFANRGLDMTFNAASGVLITIIGAVALYLVNAVTFVIAVLLFLGVSIPPASGDGHAATEDDEATESDAEDSTDDESDEYLSRLVEGFSYLRGSVVLTLSLGGIVVNFAYGVIIAVLPAFAALRGGPEVYGLLVAAMAAGSLAGSAATSLVEDQPFGRIIVVGYLVSGVCWFGAVTVSWLPATVALLLFTFVPIGVANVMLRSMVQSAVDNELLGRVSAVTSSLSTVTMPAGLLVGGAAASYFGVVPTLSAIAIAITSLSFYFLARPQLRSLPPVSEVDETLLGVE